MSAALFRKLLAAWVILLIVFVALAWLCGVALEAPLTWVDHGILRFLHERETSFWRTVAGVVTVLGTAPGYVPLAGATAVLIWPRSFRDGFSLITLLAGSAAYYVLLNRLIFSRERPSLFGNEPDFEGTSLPSGHALTTLVLMVAVCVAVRRLAPRYVPLAVVLAAGFVLVIGWTRLYLQAHFPSDVAYGWLLGATWCWVFYRLESRDPLRRQLRR